MHVFEMRRRTITRCSATRQHRHLLRAMFFSTDLLGKRTPLGMVWCVDA